MAQAACTGRTQLKAGWGARARAESTLNISRMVVTLDVSKLSGWLNATACCQVEINRGHTMRGEVRAWRREVAGDRGAGSVHGRAANKEGVPCKSKGGHMLPGEMRAGRRGGVGAKAAQAARTGSEGPN